MFDFLHTSNDDTSSLSGLNSNAIDPHARAIVEAADVAGIGLAIISFPDAKGGVNGKLELPVISYLNHAAQMMGGFSEEEIRYLPITRFIADEFLPVFHEKWASFRAGTLIRDTFEIDILHKGGYHVPISIGLTTATFGNERVVVAFLIDISERRRVEAELLAAKTEAEKTSRLKSNILSNFSHELRTPLHSILGFSSLLEDSLPNSELREYARSIHRSGRRLLTTVTSIIELASMEANSSDLVLYPTLLADIVRSEAELFQPLVMERGLKLITDIHNDNNIVLLDKERFVKAFEKILTNAIKFTNAGVIRIQLKEEMHVRGGGQPEERAILRISDTGIGMSSEFVLSAFGKFEQESSGPSRRYEGTGLGLPLARSYIRMMNGDIGLESELGKGTEVWMSFPVVGKLEPEPSEN